MSKHNQPKTYRDGLGNVMPRAAYYKLMGGGAIAAASLAVAAGALPLQGKANSQLGLTNVKAAKLAPQPQAHETFARAGQPVYTAQEMTPEALSGDKQVSVMVPKNGGAWNIMMGADPMLMHSDAPGAAAAREALQTYEQVDVIPEVNAEHGVQSAEAQPGVMYPAPVVEPVIEHPSGHK